MSSLMRKIGKYIPLVRSLVIRDEIIEKVEAEAKEVVREVMSGNDEVKKRRISEKIKRNLDEARGFIPDKLGA